jgi:hypothetical protein
MSRLSKEETDNKSTQLIETANTKQSEERM